MTCKVAMCDYCSDTILQARHDVRLPDNRFCSDECLTAYSIDHVQSMPGDSIAVIGRVDVDVVNGDVDDSRRMAEKREAVEILMPSEEYAILSSLMQTIRFKRIMESDNYVYLLVGLKNQYFKIKSQPGYYFVGLLNCHQHLAAKSCERSLELATTIISCLAALYKEVQDLCNQNTPADTTSTINTINTPSTYTRIDTFIRNMTYLYDNYMSVSASEEPGKIIKQGTHRSEDVITPDKIEVNRLMHIARSPHESFTDAYVRYTNNRSFKISVPSATLIADCATLKKCYQMIRDKIDYDYQFIDTSTMKIVPLSHKLKDHLSSLAIMPVIGGLKSSMHGKVIVTLNAYVNLPTTPQHHAQGYLKAYILASTNTSVADVVQQISKLLNLDYRIQGSHPYNCFIITSNQSKQTIHDLVKSDQLTSSNQVLDISSKVQLQVSRNTSVVGQNTILSYAQNIQNISIQPSFAQYMLPSSSKQQTIDYSMPDTPPTIMIASCSESKTVSPASYYSMPLSLIKSTPSEIFQTTNYETCSFITSRSGNYESLTIRKIADKDDCSLTSNVMYAQL